MIVKICKGRALHCNALIAGIAAQTRVIGKSDGLWGQSDATDLLPCLQQTLCNETSVRALWSLAPSFSLLWRQSSRESVKSVEGAVQATDDTLVKRKL